jgi:hypothetical protein
MKLGVGLANLLLLLWSQKHALPMFFFPQSIVIPLDIDIYIYRYMCKDIYIHIYMYIYMCTYMYIHAHVCACVCVCVCDGVSTHMCITHSSLRPSGGSKFSQWWKEMHQPGIEPGSHRWQRCILPLDH